MSASSARLKPINGVSTTTTGFVGPCRFGPLQPQLVTGLRDFEDIYGDGQELVYRSEKPGVNYLWQSARAFFEQGGQRLYIARIFNGANTAVAGLGTAIQIRARHPGSGGNGIVRFTLSCNPCAEVPEISVSTVLQLSKWSRQVWTGLSPESALNNFADNSSTPILISGALNGSVFLDALFHLKPELKSNLVKTNSTDDERSVDIHLSGGSDGARPRATDYAGVAADEGRSTGLLAFETIKNISIVAAPGCTENFARNSVDATATIQNLISHAEQMRYRFAILDSGDQQTVPDVRSLRAKLNSSYAALYYPWIRILDPVSNTGINLPPSGFVAGIFVRKDMTGSISQPPANEVLALATGFEQAITQEQQEILSSEGINCFRTFPGRGNLLWGARTISSDPEWKYVNLRRYVAYLEQSIEEGTHWVVFEPNNETLWANVRQTVTDFLYKEWTAGRMVGTRAEEAFFVKCDRTTMTQNDIDNGRLVCVIGVALTKPAEFVIFRIGQWTADRKA